MKLLVVEDDELLQQGLALALTGEGYVCDCAPRRRRPTACSSPANTAW